MPLDQLKRREFITLLGGAAAWPLVARAQQPKVPVIGFLSNRSREEDGYLLAPFRQGLREAGYVEGQNVSLEYRGAEGQNARLPALAADLVRRQVSVLITDGPSAAVAKAATTTIPVVFASGGDPVQLGLVASLGRPGGNLTGVTNMGADLGPKRLQLLKEAVPGNVITALLINPTSTTAAKQVIDLPAAAAALGMRSTVIQASNERDLDAVFASLARLGAGRLAVAGDGFFNAQLERLAALSVRYAMPAIYQGRNFAAAGGLLSYGDNGSISWRLNGIYAGRVLKGEKPSDLPVQQITKIDLTINLKTANSLGLALSPALLTRADEVIE
jgi:putative ABC transport system substrate-binding protein